MPRDSFIMGAHDVVALALGVAFLGVSALFAFLAPWIKPTRRGKS